MRRFSLNLLILTREIEGAPFQHVSPHPELAEG
jgi:hypothetical protein